MLHMVRRYSVGLATLVALFAPPASLMAQSGANTMHNPYRLLGNWPSLPTGVVWGAVIGIIGAGIAAIALVVLYAQATPAITQLVSFLPVSTDAVFVRNLAVFTLLVGLVVGSVGSYFSVRRYLSV